MNNLPCSAIARGQSSLPSLVLERFSSIVPMRPFVTQSISLSNIIPAAFAAVRPRAVEQYLCPKVDALPRSLRVRAPTFEQVSKNLVELTGIEPVTPCLQSRCSPS
jgi:hypothetical protein